MSKRFAGAIKKTYNPSESGDLIVLTFELSGRSKFDLTPSPFRLRPSGYGGQVGLQAIVRYLAYPDHQQLATGN